MTVSTYLFEIVEEYGCVHVVYMVMLFTYLAYFGRHSLMIVALPSLI